MTHRVGGEDPADLPALAQQVALEFAGNVEHPRPALVVPEVERVAHHPDVVHATVGRFVPGHFLGVLDVGDVDHVQPAPGQVVAILEPGGLARGVDLVPGKDILARPPRRVGPAEAEAVELIYPGVGLRQVVLVLGNQLGALGRATLHAVADIENDEPVVPVRQIGEAVHHHDVVQVAARLGLFGLPAADFLRVIRILDADHPHRPGRVVGDVCVPLIHVAGVHATGDGFVVVGDDLRVAGIARVEDLDPVLPVGGTFTGEDAVLAVFRGHDVVEDAGVRHHRIDDRRICRIVDVDHVGAIGDRGHVGALPGGVHPHLGREVLDRQPAQHLHPAGHPAQRHRHHLIRRLGPRGGGHGVAARRFGHEGAVVVDPRHPLASGHRPARRKARDLLARRGPAHRGEAHHVPGAHRLRRRGDVEPGDGVRHHLQNQTALRRAGGAGDGHLSRREGAQPAVTGDGGDAHVAGGKADRVVPGIIVHAVRRAGNRQPGADQHVAGDRRERHPRRGLGADFRLGPAEDRLGVLRRAHRRHEHRAAIARSEQTSRVDLALPTVLEPGDMGVGNRLARGVEGPRRELELLSHLQRGGGGTDFDLRDGRGSLGLGCLEQGEQQSWEHGA